MGQRSAITFPTIFLHNFLCLSLGDRGVQNFIQSGVPLFLGGGACTMYNVHAVVADEYHSEETTTTHSSLEYHITCFNER